MGSRPTRLIGWKSSNDAGFRLSCVGELEAKMGVWYPNWYPKNSGYLAGTQGMWGLGGTLALLKTPVSRLARLIGKALV